MIHHPVLLRLWNASDRTHEETLVQAHVGSRRRRWQHGLVRFVGRHQFVMRCDLKRNLSLFRFLRLFHLGKVTERTKFNGGSNYEFHEPIRHGRLSLQGGLLIGWKIALDQRVSPNGII